VRYRHAFLLIACGLSIGAGCEGVIGANFEAKEHSCRHTSPPPRPSLTNAGAFPDDVWAAITTLEIGEGPGDDDSGEHRKIGFDLDNNCSNLGQRPTCTPFAWADPYQTDGLDGIDNNGGALMRAQQSFFSILTFTSTGATLSTRGGNQAPLGIVRLRGYNNRRDDDAVEVDWYVAQKFGGVPKLDGTDEWPLWDETLEKNALVDAGTYPISRFRDPQAYVAEYTVVAHLPVGTPLKLANTTFITEGLTVALKFGGDLKRVETGVLGGHVRAKELFRQMPQMVRAFLDGGGNLICTNDSQYPLVKKYFCSFIDALHDGRNDPTAPCDAISLGMSFKLTAINPGPLRPDEPFRGCAREVDPAEDDCANPATPTR
jgi:hypothetical protein